MTDHANELRRYSRKIGHPAGDVPSVMLAAADEIERLAARLEAAEKSDAESIAMYRRARDERDALRAKIETAENDAAHQKALAASALRVAEGWERKCGELRAKVAEMEQQEPVGFLDGDGCAILQRKLEPWEDLYALPGAQPAPIVPDGWKLVPIMLAAATESKPCP